MSAVFVVVPAYNEGRVIRSTLQALINLNYSIVLVDDNSTDDTRQSVSDLPIYYLRHPINLGQGAALQTGTTFALQQGAKIIVHFDADGQHRAEDISNLVEPILREEADIVLGSRFLRKEHKYAVPALRRIFLQAAVWVNWLMTGLRLTDAHNGLRALTRKAAGEIYLQENGFSHASEILIQIRRLELRFVERPTKVIYSNYSKAKGQSLWNALNIVVDLILRRVF